jgi:hypothetical protein
MASFTAMPLCLTISTLILKVRTFQNLRRSAVPLHLQLTQFLSGPSLVIDSECPKTDAATQRCIVFLDTVAFSTSSKSEEEQGVVSRFLMSKLGASMLPASSNLVDTIDNTDIVDVFYLGDGREGRANDGVGVRTTSEVRRFSF